MSKKQTNPSGKTLHIVTMGILSAVLFAGKLGMSFLPNIEPVTTLIILYTLTYKKQVFPIVYTYVLLEGIVFGFGIWWVSYLYIWSILALVVIALQKIDSSVLWAVISGAFGLSFGALCAIPYLISGGPGAAFSYWVEGIPFDILHCLGNFALTLVLYTPLKHLLKRLRQVQHQDCCL